MNIDKKYSVFLKEVLPKGELLFFALPAILPFLMQKNSKNQERHRALKTLIHERSLKISHEHVVDKPNHLGSFSINPQYDP